MRVETDVRSPPSCLFNDALIDNDDLLRTAVQNGGMSRRQLLVYTLTATDARRHL